MKEFTSIKNAIRSIAGEAAKLKNIRPVSGGDINESSMLTLEDGEKFFVKMNGSVSGDFFRAEADGLAAIRSTRTLRVPTVLAGGMDENRAFIIMEYIQSSRPKADYWEAFGRNLARMHDADTSGAAADGQFGFYEDNYIGKTTQMNTLHTGWVSFFRECRLIPQARMAERYFDEKSRKQMGRLLDRLDQYLTEPEHPSILHGDLWSGNVMPGEDGTAWLIDPAVYVGNAEADLAMTELFGGFPGSFYDAYAEVNPLEPGYRDRRDIYNLYHLLNHTNLFGRGYFSAVQRILRRF